MSLSDRNISEMANESFFFIDITYKTLKMTQEPVIHLAGKRVENGTPITMQIRGFHPYFYVEASEVTEKIILQNLLVKAWIISTQKEIHQDYRGGVSREVVKIVGKHPSNLPRVCQEFQKAGLLCFEYDILFVKRFLLDTGLRCLNAYSLADIAPEKADHYILDFKEFCAQISKRDSSFVPIFLAFDIEVDLGSLTFSELIEGKERRITAIACAWGSENSQPQLETFLLAEDTDLAEKALITSFAEMIREIAPDVIFGYNSDEFDFPYLLTRMQKLSIGNTSFSAFGDEWALQRSGNKRTFRIFGKAVTDLAKKVWGIHPASGTKSLGDISFHLLGEGKVEVDDLGDLWRSGQFDDLRKYCQKDAELTYRLLFPLAVPEWFQAVQVVGMPPNQGINTTARNLGEFEVFRTCVSRKILIPPLPTKREEKQRRVQKQRNPHEGALVLEPKGTLYTAVAIVDYVSMYPSLMFSYNVGGETLKPISTEVDKPKPEEMFFKEPESCLATTMKQILDKRLEIKGLLQAETSKQVSPHYRETLDRTQKALKIILNSTIGAHNYPGSRFFDSTIANAIFSLGRNQLRRINDYLKEYTAEVGEKTRVLYGDTDSAFVWFPNGQFIEEFYHSKESERQKNREEVINRINEMLSFLNRKFPGILRLELEDIAYRVIFQPGRRKAYAYVSALSQELTIRGFEAIRSDWSPMAQETQKRVLDTLLREQVEGEENVRKATEVVIEQGLKILAMPLRELKDQITIMSPVRKAPHDYKSPTPAVGAFLHHCKLKKTDPDTTWKEFDRFPWVALPGSGSLWERSRHPQFARNVDRLHYIQETLAVAARFGVQVSIDEIARRHKQGPLDKFLEKN
ncbi:MAG: DNA polymerase domain-containing protein [Candidatus Hodarchaeales archaeon]|jgi:DNA polymerase I